MRISEFSVEQLAEHIDGLGASVAVIDSATGSSVRTAELTETVDRNVRHLEIMLSMPHIQAAGADLSPYEAAISAGKAWLAAS